MTVATSSTFEFSIDQTVRAAYRQASLINDGQEPRQSQYQAGREMLELILKNGQAYGLFARKVDFITIPLVAGQYIYSLATNVFDLTGAGAYIDPSQSDLTKATAETPVFPMSRESWQQNAAKAASARPSLYYLHRAATPLQVYFWPVPGTSENGAHVRLEGHLLRADNVPDGTPTVDVERYWGMFLVYRLAHDLALSNGLPIPRVMYLGSLADKESVRCRGYSMQSVNQQFMIDHSTPWSRRR